MYSFKQVKNCIFKINLISSLSVLFKVTIPLSFAILIASCANIVPPSGGPKDTTPPKVIHSTPDNHSTNFTGNVIKLNFSEFVKLKNASSQVIISPPMEKQPEFKEKGKSILIEFHEERKANTTYTIYFGDAIVDITEENPATNYQFVFATGPVIDTLSIGGKVLDAFDQRPQQGIYVMLYEHNEDSVPMKEKPYYISKTDANGKFELNNLKNGSYKIFALKDVNSNYLFDLPNEQIAFLDTLLKPEPIKSYIKSDSLAHDSLTSDSLSKNVNDKSGLSLMLFEETDSTQRIVHNAIFRTGLVKLVFKYPLKKLQLIPLDKTLPADWCLLDLNHNRDSLDIWNKNIERDTVSLIVKDDTSILDTLHLNFVVRGRGRREVSAGKVEKLHLTSKAFGKFDLNNNVIINCSNPIQDYNFSKAVMIEGTDTLKPKSIAFVDSIKRNIKISRDWKENTSYQFIIPDSCLFDIYGYSNDSLIISFITNELRDYGTLKINITLIKPGSHYIIQLLNKDEKVLKENRISDNGWVIYDYLKPGDYKVKAISDLNNNGHWDRGIYLKHQQPEPVFYLKKTFQIRANWEIEESWTLPQ